MLPLGATIIAEMSKKAELLSMLRLVAKARKLKFHAKNAKKATKSELEHAFIQQMANGGYQTGLYFS